MHDWASSVGHVAECGLDLRVPFVYCALGAAQAALLQCVAVLFMIFQVPSMRSSVCRSTHPSNRSSALSNPRRTDAISPA
jgi:hypothetical protein